MWVCENADCRSETEYPENNRFTGSCTLDAWGEVSTTDDMECFNCGEYAVDCYECESGYWCPTHRSVTTGEVYTSDFTKLDVKWITAKKEVAPVRVTA